MRTNFFYDNMAVVWNIFDPFNKELSKSDQRKCLIASIAIGILTLGILHLIEGIVHGYRLLKNVSRRDMEQKTEQDSKIFNKWKDIFFIGDKDVDYPKPKSDLSEEYKSSMKSMEFAMADTCLSFVLDEKNGYFDLLNTLVSRSKDTLQAYIAVKYPGANQQLKLYEVLREIYNDHDADSGSIGNSPLAILNLINGKKDKTMDPQALFRTKMYFLYRLNGLYNEIMISKKMQSNINTWLVSNQKGWILEKELIASIMNQVPLILKKVPLYCYGANAIMNMTHFLREKLDWQDVKKKHQADPNLTFSESEKMAQQPIDKRYKTKFSPQEEFHYMGELPENERKTKFRRKIMSQGTSHADTSFAESPLDYKKRTQQVLWIPGKHYYNLHSDSRLCNYNRMVQDLALPIIAGISGTIDQSFQIAGFIGLHTKEDLIKIRMLYMAWMISSEDHSYHEIMMSSKSFNLEYNPGPDSYKQVLPGNAEFIAKLEQEQAKRGYMLPDHYFPET